jgi:diguanylate cyclase (GGDEF)-like protein/PAS domain S-box-containing protein
MSTIRSSTSRAGTQHPRRRRPATKSAWMSDAVDATDVALWRYDVDSRRVQLSAPWARMIGLPPDATDTDIDSLTACVPAQDRENVRLALVGAMKSRDGLYRVEHRVTREDGETIPVLSVGRVVQRDAAGRAICMVGSSRDMSWYADTLEALRRSEQRFKTAIEFSPIGIALVSPDGRWLTVNRALCAIVGYTESQLLKLTFQDITHPEDLDADLKLLQETLAGKRDDYTMEKRYIHRDGGEVWVQLNVSLVRDACGDPVQFVSQVQDISERKRMVHALRDSEQRLQNALQNSPIGMAMVGLDGRFLSVNRALCAIVGYSEAELLALRFPDITHPDDLQTDLAYVDELVNGKRGSYEMEKRYVRKDGAIVWIQLNGSVVRNQLGQPLHFIAQIQDISGRHRDRQKLEESEQRLEFALLGADLGTWDWNLETGHVEFNERWAAMLGYQLSEIEPNVRTWERLVHPDDLPRVMQILESHIRGELPIYETEHRMLSNSGEWVWILDRGRVVERAPDGRALRASGTHLDITDKIAAQQRAEFLALHDPLTDLANKRLMRDRLDVALSAARRKETGVALMFIDLDGFKPVNDAHGHAAGDTVLRTIAMRLNETARGTDTIARIGGDEFVVLSPDYDSRSGIERFARRIIESISEPIALADGASVRVSASLGVALYPEDGSDGQTLLKRADAAMYQAKRTGGKRLAFFDLAVMLA